MTFRNIAEALLKKKNCAIKCDRLGYVQDLHGFVREDMLIVNRTSDPNRSPRCIMLKENLKYLLENYDKLRKGSPNTRIK